MLGITYNGRHSYQDFKIPIESRDIGIASKQKNLITVPFSNIQYDFSELYGSQVYEPRPLTYVFTIMNKQQLNVQYVHIIKTKLLNWLSSTRGKVRLYDDAIPGYYFLAEFDEGGSFQDDWKSGLLTANFTAYPFMIADLPEGNDIWDSFNFELDVSQKVRFDVNGQLSINLLNAGTPDVTPRIVTSSAMTLKKDQVTMQVPAGTSQSDDFTLQPGDNIITITGKGSIEFVYYKEMR
ncbi:phage tail protein [Bacillus massiliglaciei]|uniref:phage tail protein n=1 Tax=Bacillus massiliglaciei TaxID=1816693 RepID=UPI000DA61B51|nr:phage tail protein [Bacillus massiliglaciei]